MRLGVLDVGSNTVHLLLLDVYPGSRPEPYASHKLALRLVQYLDADGNISDAGRDALTAFVVEARDFAVDNRAEDFLAFATSAIREAGKGSRRPGRRRGRRPRSRSARGGSPAPSSPGTSRPRRR